MTPPRLSRGQNVPLPVDTIRIDAVIGWAESTVEVDASALLLGAGGTGSGTHARIVFDLSAVPDHVHAVALVGSIATGNFGALGELRFTILGESGRSLAEYAATDVTTETAFVFGKVYRRAGTWRGSYA